MTLLQPTSPVDAFRLVADENAPWTFRMIPTHPWQKKKHGDTNDHTILNRNEMMHLSTFRHPKRQREWAAGRIAAKLALHDLHVNIGMPSPLLTEIQIQNSQAAHNYGQPLANVHGYIGISHSQQFAVAAASRYPVGIDIERRRVFSPSTKTMIFTEHERQLPSLSCHDEDMLYTTIWAFKEAFMKAQGKSVFGWFADIELHHIDQDGEISWRLSEKLASQTSLLKGFKLKAISRIFDDYAIAIVGQCPA